LNFVVERDRIPAVDARLLVNVLPLGIVCDDTFETPGVDFMQDCVDAADTRTGRDTAACRGQLRLRTPDSDPLNPASWIKSGPIFTGNDRIHGVGHASFTTSPDGNEYWIYYHSKKDTVHNWGRDVRLQRFDFDATGNPRFGEPAEPGPYPMPSGTPKHAN